MLYLLGPNRAIVSADELRRVAGLPHKFEGFGEMRPPTGLMDLQRQNPSIHFDRAARCNVSVASPSGSKFAAFAIALHAFTHGSEFRRRRQLRAR